MSKILALIAAALMLFGLTLGLTGCGSEPTELPEGTVVIDVRTPEEFAGGHLDGAINIDAYATDFADTLAGLPTDGSYFVYCRSGNRSGRAVSQMERMGFTAVIDGGAMSTASSTSGIPVTTTP